MSDPENVHEDSATATPRRKEDFDEVPGDNIGNLRPSDDDLVADDNIGNRRDPNEEQFVADDIGNRTEQRGRPPRGQGGPGGRGGGGGTGGGGRGRRRGRRRPRQDREQTRGPSRPMPAEPPARYVLKSDPEEKRAAAERVCGEIVRLCQRQAEVKAELVEESGQPKVVVVVTEQGDDSPLFTRNSAALSALNFLTNKVVNRFPDDRIRLVVHVHSVGGPPPSERAPREPRQRDAATEAMALRLAEHAVRVNRVLSIAPIRSDLRRVVHVTLESNPDVVTMSEGEGAFRKLLIVPRALLKRGREEERAETAAPVPEAP